MWTPFERTTTPASAVGHPLASTGAARSHGAVGLPHPRDCFMASAKRYIRPQSSVALTFIPSIGRGSVPCAKREDATARKSVTRCRAGRKVLISTSCRDRGKRTGHSTGIRWSRGGKFPGIRMASPDCICPSAPARVATAAVPRASCRWSQRIGLRRFSPPRDRWHVACRGDGQQSRRGRRPDASVSRPAAPRRYTWERRTQGTGRHA